MRLRGDERVSSLAPVVEADEDDEVGDDDENGDEDVVQPEPDASS
jgi:hypothetical protein